jgi:hypothetical protein
MTTDKQEPTTGKETEAELRDLAKPWPRTQDELHAYIESLVKRDHDYGTCVYAMSLSALAAFNYVAHKLGVTGFQASCADLDIVRRSRSIEGPFMLTKGQDMLFPQYDPLGEVEKALKATDPSAVHPDVWAHWQALVKNAPPEQA